MTASQSLVPYRGPPTSASLTTTSRSGPLISSRFFNAQTGTAIATELLYRILIEIINRVITSFQKFASARLDDFGSYLERRAAERRERQAAEKARTPSARDSDGLRIVQEVSKLAEESGFVACPIQRRVGAKEGEVPQWVRRRGPPVPPRWVRDVLDGFTEGRMEESDFWIQTHGD